ncbi:MAG: hypothetical protein LBP83_04625 [Dysgonamonadaceae bacterium]|jgi:hypothetical protein|nr:hypothetical protein [Dysgonamonadaceae bacterium]
METIYRINIRSTLLGMHPGDVFEFPKKDYNSLSIRASATMLKEAFGKAYSVSAKDPEKIVVTRVS